MRSNWIDIHIIMIIIIGMMIGPTPHIHIIHSYYYEERNEHVLHVLNVVIIIIIIIVMMLWWYFWLWDIILYLISCWASLYSVCCECKYERVNPQHKFDDKTEDSSSTVLHYTSNIHVEYWYLWWWWWLKVRKSDHHYLLFW